MGFGVWGLGLRVLGFMGVPEIGCNLLAIFLGRWVRVAEVLGSIGRSPFLGNACIPKP